MKKLVLSLASATIIIVVIFCVGRDYNKTNESVRIDIDFCGKNTSRSDILFWGSEVGLSAKVSYNTGIEWSISNDGSKDIEVSTIEYQNKKGDSCF